jgi:hypothetical protein
MAKTVNYTPEMEAVLREDYANGVAVEAIAAKVGRSVRSVVAKLSRLGVYKAKEYTAKNGTAPVKKESLADKIGVICELTEAEMDSVAKANKTALTKILAHLS